MLFLSPAPSFPDPDYLHYLLWGRHQGGRWADSLSLQGKEAVEKMTLWPDNTIRCRVCNKDQPSDMGWGVGRQGKGC